MSRGHNIRYFFGTFIGSKVVDITQSDHDDPNGPFVEILFESGGTIRFYSRETGPSFATEHCDCECQLCKDEESNDG